MTPNPRKHRRLAQFRSPLSGVVRWEEPLAWELAETNYPRRELMFSLLNPIKMLILCLKPERISGLRVIIVRVEH